MREKLVTEQLPPLEIERLLGKTADILRSAARSEGYFNHILARLFFKRLCHGYSEGRQVLLEEFGSAEIAAKKFRRFLTLQGRLWEDTNVGQKLNDTLAQIAKSIFRQ